MKRKWSALAIVTVLLTVLAAGLLIGAEEAGLLESKAAMGYEERLFDDSYVHTIDIYMDGWQTFLDEAAKEEYRPCMLSIDGEEFANVAIRAKGNNSLRLTEKYGHKRYSLKVEFDHYFENSYYGLDKFSLDSSFQDNSYLKTALTYDMMEHMGVVTPLCSYVWVRVNGQDWGLFLAIEEPEESFAKRNWGEDHGMLYKPDYTSLNAENADVALRYVGDDAALYPNIFDNAKFDISDTDKKRLIRSLKTLDSGQDLETAVDVDATLRYFTVQVFVVNMDSYLGRTGHNYFLYEKDGVLTILPWDYNLAYATYSLGMPDPINDSTLYVNYPINTPAAGSVMKNRPLYHKLMQNNAYYARYHEYFDAFIRDYFESGYFEEFVAKTEAMIAPYVQKDPTAFCSFEDHKKAVETIEKFCLLRAKSVRGQLDGSIPSTIAAQAEDKSSFIDASEVWLPDMGEVADLKDDGYPQKQEE
ncbi:MAG: CotH kinase family protein [Christensenellaceae bacterium]|nr:CotH kinase family protein [Christensenellaceae bacterium]